MDNASILYREGKYSESLECLKKALSIDKKDPTAYFLCGNALQRIGNLDWAIAAFRSAQMLAPTTSEAHANIANMYQRRGEFAFAASEYKRALQKNPDDRVAKHNIRFAEQMASEILQGSIHTTVIDHYDKGSRLVDLNESRNFHSSPQDVDDWVAKCIPSAYKSWTLFLDGAKSSRPDCTYVFHGFYPFFSFGETSPWMIAAIPKPIFWEMRKLLSIHPTEAPFEHTRTVEKRFWLGPDGVQRYYLLFDDKHKTAIPLRFILPREQDDLMRGTQNYTITIHPWVASPRDPTDWQSQPFEEVTVYISLTRSGEPNAKLKLIWGPKVKCFNCRTRVKEDEARIFATINEIMPAWTCLGCFETCRAADKNTLTSKIMEVTGELYGVDTINATRVNGKLVLRPIIIK